MVKTLVRIVVVSDDTDFVERLKNLVDHPQVVVDRLKKIPKDTCYDFYVIGDSTQLTGSVAGSPIYLSGSVCKESVPVRKLIKCNIVDCLENENNIRAFVKEVSSLCRQKIKIYEASCKLDSLKSGNLQDLARQLKKTKSDRFIDYIQNHPLPMVLVSRDGDVLHANVAMETMIGSQLHGAPASIFWVDPDEFDKTLFDLKEKGHLLGREVTLKDIDGKSLPLKLYTSLHCDKNGEWLNTRCLFVPIDQIPPE